ncbi:thymidine phosphorylase-like [Neocloeon triangulifer]|uniref:thymidine phosphorylase-like n=1 Tax=Neocloeon triangulifer TaxID=2078957 RepID=UPI00286F03FE|nr:thymidine phosphorylase-like [Neocloeon triangulifer]
MQKLEIRSEQSGGGCQLDEMRPSVLDVIAKKRDGHELSREEIEAFVTMVTDGTAQDCQIGAMLMAIYLNDMTEDETTNFTRACVNSGERLEWPKEWPLVDKHSTGGVGDKVSIPMAPALAACGLKVPMVSGRGLDFTGGTLDKLESVPGFRVQLSKEEMGAALENAGCFIAGQTDKLVPADRELYKRRDVTATVGSDPLVVGSIVSKKVAAGASALVMDVKVGRAAVFKSQQRAEQVASKLIGTANKLGLKTKAVLTAMDVPIGRTVGNALEIAESLECLRGRGPHDLRQLVLTLSGVLLEMHGVVETVELGEAKVAAALDDGSALQFFQKMLECQGVSAEVAEKLCFGDEWTILPRAKFTTDLIVSENGFVGDLDALEIARVCRELGAGRSRADQELDLSVGVSLLKEHGEPVGKGDPWLRVHHSSSELSPGLKERLQGSLRIATQKPELSSRILKIVG